jgi:membrane protein DedA with SNARE-associated domain
VGLASWAADVAAAILWATYATMLGFAGGSAFAGAVWQPLAISLGIAAAVIAGMELWRRAQLRRGKDLLGDDLTN